MAHKFKLISWNRQKIIYDGILVGSVSLYIIGYIMFGVALDANANFITLRMRAFGSVAFIMLHIILLMGPLSRLSPKFLPFLYNRRHMGVLTFIVACFHAYYVVIEYHKWGKLEPIFNIFLGNTNYDSLTQFPFQTLGAIALLIFFFMTITSHDFWLSKLTPFVWKSLHIFVYVAYILLVMHVILGPAQFETNPLLIGSVVAGALSIVFLHLFTAIREIAIDRKAASDSDGFIEAGSPDEIKEGRAKIVRALEERVAIYKHKGALYAVSNVCTHQNGPLGEGKIIDGCITCPWHGYQFNPEDGKAPAPYEDEINTYVLRLEKGRILLNPTPNPLGTKITPVTI